MSDLEFRRRLEIFAAQNGIDAIERKVRAAIDKGKYAEASRLRDDALTLMRKAHADIKHELTSVSSERSRIQASLTRQSHTARSS